MGVMQHTSFEPGVDPFHVTRVVVVGCAERSRCRRGNPGDLKRKRGAIF
jgi:hypothetical protein